MSDRSADPPIADLVVILQQRPCDKAATTELVEKSRRLALPVARSLIDASTLDDVVQDAILEMLAELPALRDPHAFPAWFRRIVRKHADRHRRQRRQHVALDETTPDARPSPEDVVQATELTQLVRSALLHARDRDRILLNLKYVAEWDDRQLADLLGITAGAVRKRLFDARRRVRPVLAQSLNLTQTQPRQEKPLPYHELFGAVHAPADLLKYLPETTPQPKRIEPLEPLHTGFPVIDLLVPLPRGGVAAWRAGSLYMISELIGNLAAGGPAALVAVGARRPLPNGIYHRLHRLVIPTGTAPLVVVIDVRDGNDEDAVRDAARLAALMAADGTDVILGLDAVISPTIPAALLRTYAGSVGVGSVTVLTFTDPALSPLTDSGTIDDLAPLNVTDYDAVLAFTTPELLRGMSPPVDLEHSWSKVTDSPAVPSARIRAASRARELIERANDVRLALSEPFDLGDGWSGHSARHVPIDEVLERVGDFLTGP